LLSRALGNRRSWRLRRGSPAAGAGEAGTVAGDGEGEGDDAETRDSDIPPAQEGGGAAGAAAACSFVPAVVKDMSGKELNMKRIKQRRRDAMAIKSE